MGRGDDEHRLIARYAARLAQHNTMPRSGRSASLTPDVVNIYNIINLIQYNGKIFLYRVEILRDLDGACLIVLELSVNWSLN